MILSAGRGGRHRGLGCSKYRTGKNQCYLRPACHTRPPGVSHIPPGGVGCDRQGRRHHHHRTQGFPPRLLLNVLTTTKSSSICEKKLLRTVPTSTIHLCNVTTILGLVFLSEIHLCNVNTRLDIKKNNHLHIYCMVRKHRNQINLT